MKNHYFRKRNSAVYTFIMEEGQNQKSWLKTLAEQSWEAELIVSGVAIFGALSLPGQLEHLMDWLFIRLPDIYLTYASLLILYLYFAIQLMIAGFLIHFVLRVTWIGFVGLYSVFPEGVRSISTYSEDFNNKLQKDFSSLENYTKSLDDASSTVFAAANSAILSLFSICATGTVFVIIAAIIHSFIPQFDLSIILIVLIGIVVSPVMFSSFLHLKILREKKWVQAIHYPLYKNASLALLNFAYKPLTYLILTFYSNVKVHYYVIPFMGLAFMFGLFGGENLATSTFPFFKKDRYFDHSKRSNYVLEEYYADEKEEGKIVIHAMLPSSHMESPYLEIFLPKLKREVEAREEFCGTYEANPDLDEGENSEARRAFFLDCLGKFNELYVDDSLYTPIDIAYTRLPENNQRGYSMTLDLERLEKGPHSLTIKKQYFLENGDAKTIKIPFLYVPKPLNHK